MSIAHWADDMKKPALRARAGWGSRRGAIGNAAGQASGHAGVLEDAARCVDPIRELFEQSLLRARLVVVLRQRFGRGRRRHRAKGLVKLRNPRVHDVGSLYDAHMRCWYRTSLSNAHAIRFAGPTTGRVSEFSL
jgi:hypothetical protein